MTSDVVGAGVGFRHGFRVGLGFETLDERVGLVTGELAPGLALREPERTSSVAKVDVPGRVDQVRELLHLAVRRGRARGLTECHGGHCSRRVRRSVRSPVHRASVLDRLGLQALAGRQVAEECGGDARTIGSEAAMRSLVVCESLFGNTEAVAHAIAEGLSRYGEVAVLTPDAADSEEVSAADLLVVGTPTHAWGLPRASSWADGKPETVPRGAGRLVRDWLIDVGTGNGRPAASFATRLDKPHVVTGSAARGIARRLRRRGWSQVAPPTSFVVLGTKGPLRDGELERARAWGDALGVMATGKALVQS